jgi:hypothetical protein
MYRLAVSIAAAVLASALAAVGWTRAPSEVRRPTPGIRIVDVHPLHSPEPSLDGLITHTFAVRVALRGWTLLPYEPGVSARDNGSGAGHWRLYLDGRRLADNLGGQTTTYVRIDPGTHWLTADLSNADSTSLTNPLFAEPVILHVPRHMQCWQTGWRGGPERGMPIFTCHRGSRGRPARHPPHPLRTPRQLTLR